jgi:two-component system C4-dicarboxylate transport sensor histidine kinase DctB
LLAALAIAAAYLLAEGSGIRKLRETAAQRLEVYGGSLRSELRRYDYLPAVLGLNDDVIAALADAHDRPAVDEANRYLETVAADARVAAIYVMDLKGLTIAASNWSQRASFVGMNFAFRPYFQNAVRGGLGRFYGVGTVSYEPGYYFASGVYRNGRMVGVAAVKVSLDTLGDSWANPGEVVLVADENGVIFLSSVPALKFKTLNPLSAAALGTLGATRQYHTLRSFEPAGLTTSRRLLDDTQVTHFTPVAIGDAAPALPPGEYLLQSRDVFGTQWDLLMLSDLAPVKAAARNAAAAAGFASLATVALLLYGLQRKRITQQRLASKAALERAYGDLENQVALRTEDLRTTNAHLQREIGERSKAEKALQDTLEELVQAGKMAALGQMATGITHELNQPLAALRTLSDNAKVLLQRGRTADARENLEYIGELVERMGHITGQLKSFARKTPARLQPVDLQRVVADAVFLMEQRLRAEGIDLRLRPAPEGTCALCDGNRLQQVLVNLIGNAIDAMAGAPRRRLTIRVTEADGRASISVRDTGAGIAPDAQARLFEPFFTTKAQGSGLGLGLAISAGIVKEFGGTLKAANCEPGAEFTVLLSAVQFNEALNA